MPSTAIRKNVLDLQYQRNLNYLNIFLAGVFGATVTFWLSADFALWQKAGFSFISFAFTVFIWTFFTAKLDETIEEIEKTARKTRIPTV